MYGYFRFDVENDEESYLEEKLKEDSPTHMSLMDSYQGQKASADKAVAEEQSLPLADSSLPSQSQASPVSQPEPETFESQAASQVHQTEIHLPETEPQPSSDPIDQSETSTTFYPIFSESCTTMKTLLPCQSFFRESGSTGKSQNLIDI